MPSLSGGIGGLTTGAKLGSGWGPIGTGIGALAGGLLGGIFGGAKSPQDIAEGAILKNIPNLITQGQGATNEGLGNLKNAETFYQGILGGNRDTIANLLGPTSSTILSQYDNAAKQVQQFGGRGGGATATLAQLPFQKATSLGQVYQNVLPGAASGLTQVGGAQGQIGQGLTGSAMGQGPGLLDYQQLEEKMINSGGKGLGQIAASGGQGGFPGVGGASLPGTFGGQVPGAGNSPTLGGSLKQAGSGIGALLAKIFGGRGSGTIGGMGLNPGYDGSVAGTA